jgi:hypothetical protein
MGVAASRAGPTPPAKDPPRRSAIRDSHHSFCSPSPHGAGFIAAARNGELSEGSERGVGIHTSRRRVSPLMVAALVGTLGSGRSAHRRADWTER